MIIVYIYFGSFLTKGSNTKIGIAKLQKFGFYLTFILKITNSQNIKDITKRGQNGKVVIVNLQRFDNFKWIAKIKGLYHV